MSELYVLVMAGGRGVRFWPRSRRSLPKQCIALDEGRTLLQQTVDRLLPLVPVERVLVVTGPDMAPAVRAQLPEVPDENILVEPSGRNTAPCIGWGAVEVGRRGGGKAVMAVLPADHMIENAAELRDVLKGAAEAASNTHALITLGVPPTRPETGFGYLEVGALMGEWNGRAFQMVERFTEKPDEATAQRWLDGESHLWNAGMFVFTVDAIRDAFRSHLPESAEALAAIQRKPERLLELWPQLEATSVDYGIMEQSRHILVAPFRAGWSDVGSWNGVAPFLPEVAGGRGLADTVIAVGAEGCVVHAPGRVVALVGVQDLVVVDAGDALLVMDRHRAGDVREVVAQLEAAGMEKLT
jgi:mannose-1-phosphate guanylyltransferase